MTFLSYFALGRFNKSSQKELEELRAAISEKRTPRTKELEEEVLSSKKKIDIFSTLLDSHKKSSGFFKFLKETCHKKISFSKVDLDIEEAKVELSGKAESFRVLGEQVLILKKENLIQNLSLSKVSLGREGGIEFDLVLFLNPKVFK